MIPRINSLKPQDEALLRQHAEDEADLRAFEEAKAEYDANPVSYSHDEVARMLGIQK